MERLLELLEGSSYTAAMTGAGISTLSGIQDFRGKNGFYKTDPDADKVFDIVWFQRDPSLYYRKSRNLIYDLESKQPNIIHRELARWEKGGRLKGVITQNIDLLHQKAGSREIAEVHGSPAFHDCLSCGKTYPFAEVVELLKTAEAAFCPACGGVIKPRITFFGESLPVQALNLAVRHAEQARLLLVLGTSLTVYPAAGLPDYTLSNGGRVVIVNSDPTPFDRRAAAVYRDLGEVFEFLSRRFLI
ncbi:MAG: NAD-dependent deacetylase [Spirochaetales bacterium]|jgi:NAD-dependent deacetylase|nr:NAD-dependent deacetylase [Spirochaetales bacterium]